MNRKQVRPFVSFLVNDAGAARRVNPREPLPAEARLVGWRCGFKPLFVAVHSYLPGVRLDDQEAEDLAADYLRERGWFTVPAGANADDFTIPADYIV